jgi:hypothetical protein
VLEPAPEGAQPAVCSFLAFSPQEMTGIRAEFERHYWPIKTLNRSSSKRRASLILHDKYLR